MRLMFMRLGVYLFRGMAFSDNSTNKQILYIPLLPFDSAQGKLAQYKLPHVTRLS